jgi:formylglycine-generating enzyme required for sulfatase activity
MVQLFMQAMNTARYIVIGMLVAGGIALLPRATSAQYLHVGGGSTLDHAGLTNGALSPTVGGQIALRAKYTDLFQVYGGVTYGTGASLEGGVSLRPWQGQTLDPYVQVGFGRYVASSNNATSVIPIGLGFEYRLNDRTGLFLEIEHRWSAFEEPPRQERAWTPRIGVSYRLNDPKSKMPNLPPLAADSIATDTLEAGRFGGQRFDPDRYPGMVLVPDGMFIMGLTAEDPLALQNAGRKHVTVNAFYIDETEVTNADYRVFLNDMPREQRDLFLPDSTIWAEVRSQESWATYFRSPLFEDYPVIGVTWEQARDYCQAHEKRLPTEAEWEYAARAGHLGRIYPWDGFDTRTNDGRYLVNYNPARGGYAADGFAFTSPVDAFPANDWGLHGMTGNVAEWVRDAYTPSYDDIADFNPFHQDEEQPQRIVRGGSWTSSAFYIGVAARDTQHRSQPSATVGFRCVREVSVLEQDFRVPNDPVTPPTPPPATTAAGSGN